MFSVKSGDTLISVDIGFLAVIALISLNGGEKSGLSFAACIVHELGHIAAVYLCGNSVRRISFGINGISMHRDGKLSSPREDILILVSGPAASLVTALAAFLVAGKAGYFCVINAVLGIFNLLPFSALDGGSAAEIFSEYHFSGKKYRVMLSVFCIALCLLLIASLRRLPFFNVSFYITGIFLCVTELKNLYEIAD